MAASFEKTESERRRAEKALRESENLNRAILSSLTNNIAVLDRAGTIIVVNDAWKRFAAENGAPELAEKSIGMNYLEVCRQASNTEYDAATRALTGITEVLEGRRNLFTLEYPCHSPNEQRWFLLYATPLVRGQGGAVVSHINITERKQTEELLNESEQKMRALLEGVPHGVYECDTEGRVTATNESYSRITGYSKKEILTMHVWDFMEPGPQKDSLPAYLEQLAAEQPPPEPYICRNITKDGSAIDVQVDWTYKRTEEGRVTGFICILSDITERRRCEEMIRRQATHDDLTGLPNRMLFMDRLRSALNHARRSGQFLAILFLDIDDLKAVNDTLGHDIGDKLLVSVADRLRSCVRITDTVARIGGDEYNILLAPVAHEEDVRRIADKIIFHIREPMMIGGSKFHITASAGVSIYPENGEEADTLLKNADVALYHIKRHGKNGYIQYSPAMIPDVSGRRI